MSTIAEPHERRKNNRRENPFLNSAELILPWLTPQELATISLTCKSLHHITTSIAAARSSDASRSIEKLPVPFINTVDSHPYTFFIYTPTQLLSSPPLSRQYWGPPSPSNPSFTERVFQSQLLHNSTPQITVEGGVGCKCGPECGNLDSGECPCSGLRSIDVITECGPSCGCKLDCWNRLTQKGLGCKVKIVKDRRKGWGLFADQRIPSGQFVCEYTGELLTTKEARRRQMIYDGLASSRGFSYALLVVREHLPSGKACFRINIDATRVGNVARFVNHSCDGGNLSSVLVRSSGALLPRICFFASRDVEVGEELTFSYGGIRLGLDGLPCFCGSPCCYGTLPSEIT